MTGFRQYSVWELDDHAISMTTGTDIPRYANGKPQSEKNVLVFTIEARTWEEAMAIRNLRLGWEPYQRE
jgi:hypothetical protein